MGSCHSLQMSPQIQSPRGSLLTLLEGRNRSLETPAERMG